MCVNVLVSVFFCVCACVLIIFCAMLLQNIQRVQIKYLMPINVGRGHFWATDKIKEPERLVVTKIGDSLFNIK
jgi:CxxC motif-containing protein